MDGPSRLLDDSRPDDAIGNFTAGLAHELNNTFSVVIGSVGIVREEYADKPLDEDGLTLLDDALSAGREGARLIENLLACVGRQTLRPERVDVVEMVNGLVPLLEQTLPEGIALEVETTGGTPAAWADPGRLRQCVLNLVANAREAMSEGGRLRIAVAPSPDDTVTVRVVDDGVGMDALTLGRACEPFFSTRRARRGRGIGLGVARGFAEQSGGRLELESEPRAGTTVTLVLPSRP